MTCRDCTHYLPSANAGQRAFIDGWGYCKAASTLEDRARFFPQTRECWLVPVRFNQVHRA